MSSVCGGNMTGMQRQWKISFLTTSSAYNGGAHGNCGGQAAQRPCLALPIPMLTTSPELRASYHGILLG